MLGTPNVYYIWYGNWDGNDAVNILTDFAQNLSPGPTTPSPYFNINTVHFERAGMSPEAQTSSTIRRKRGRFFGKPAG